MFGTGPRLTGFLGGAGGLRRQGWGPGGGGAGGGSMF